MNGIKALPLLATGMVLAMSGCVTATQGGMGNSTNWAHYDATLSHQQIQQMRAACRQQALTVQSTMESRTTNSGMEALDNQLDATIRAREIFSTCMEAKGFYRAP